MLITFSASLDVESARLCVGARPTSIFLLQVPTKSIFIPLLLSEERHTADNIYCSPRSPLLLRTFVLLRNNPLQIHAPRRDPRPATMTKRIHAPRGECTSLAPRVIARDPSPPRRWIVCLPTPYIPCDGPL